MFFPKGFEMELAHCFLEINIINVAFTGNLQRWGRDIGFLSYNPLLI